jgi:hypothetical protein
MVKGKVAELPISTAPKFNWVGLREIIAFCGSEGTLILIFGLLLDVELPVKTLVWSLLSLQV